MHENRTAFTPPTDPNWAEFAETFFEAEEDRLHDSFLARNAIRFLEATEFVTVEARIAQSAIPEIADGCLIALRAASGDWEEAIVANRYEEEAEAFQALRKLPEALREILLRTREVREISREEREQLARILPSLTGAVVIALGSIDSPKGFALFAQTRSGRAFTASTLRIIRDLALFGEQVLFQAKGVEGLREEVREREKFLSIASHELKTPLTALKLQIETLRRGFRREGAAYSPERIERSLGNLERSVERLDQSIGMLFNLSEVRTGKISLVKELGDLAQLVRDVVARMEPMMKKAGCQVEATVPDEVPAFFDERRIEQALLNLLANAAKYAPCVKVEITLQVVDPTAKISVRDHGPGIPEEHRKSIFEAFTRGSAQAKVEGLGLGLFVTQGVVRAHGGKLSLTSVPGDGACFEIELPRWQA
jgi:signal transduction histidine kinase